MKLIALILTLSLLASCKGGPSEESEDAYSTYTEAAETFDPPEVGFYRGINLNYRFTSVYEYMYLKPDSRNPVPGHKPFVLFLYEEDRIELNYYREQDIKSVSYINLGKSLETSNFKDVNIEILSDLRLKKIKNPFRSFEFGSFDPNFPEQDMAGKVFFVESEAADLPYVSKMTVMFWLECDGGLKWKSKEEYSCPTKLKFNYKLLKYKLDKLID